MVDDVYLTPRTSKKRTAKKSDTSTDPGLPSMTGLPCVGDALLADEVYKTPRAAAKKAAVKAKAAKAGQQPQVRVSCMVLLCVDIV